MNRFSQYWKAPLSLVLCCLVTSGAIGCAQKEQQPQQEVGSRVQTGTVTQAICTSSQLTASSATASSTENSGFPASEAIDGTTGDSSNRWSSAASGTNVVQWLYVDLGADRHINKVEIDFVTTNAWSKDFTLSVAPAGATDFSVNSASWTTVYTRTGVVSSDSRNHVITTSSSPALTATSGRYLRFKSTLHNISNVSFYEMRVFGSTDASCNVACTPSCGACSTCTSGVCVPLANGTVCRAAVAGGCDPAETCDGTATDCPSDVVATNGTVCRAFVAGGCDIAAETCDGSANTCPADTVAASGTVCRATAGACDAQETCNGTANACPADSKQAAGTVCRASVAGGCDPAETCNGSADACPTDVVATSGTVCRAAAGSCDVQETCNGSANTCPADAKQSSGTECRAAVAGGCDLAETCNGTATSCPADLVATNGTVCRAFVSGGCDVAAETCNGTAATCPADTVGAACTPCGNTALTRNAAVASSSINGNVASNAIDGTPGNTGSSRWESTQGHDPEWIYVDLGADRHISEVKINWEAASAKNYTIQVAPNGTCSGSSSGCLSSSTNSPWTTIYTSPTITTTNRTDDLTLTGVGRYVRMHGTTRTTSYGYSIEDFAIYGDTSAVCGTQCSTTCGACADCVNSACVTKTAGTVCRAAVAGGCDVAETCNGSVDTCPSDAVVASGTVCRTSAGTCDVAETCSGSAATCPTNVVLPADTECRAAAGVCDTHEVCNGTSGACPSNAFTVSGTSCRTANGVCDATETCSGSSANCPSDAKKASGTVCRTSAGTCDNQETCNGTSDTCPTDAFKSSSTVCRTAISGGCDIAETCSGTAAACPTDVVAASGTVCRALAGGCDIAETCNGSTGTCPANGFAASGTECREFVGDGCDLAAETCSGSNASCPLDDLRNGCAEPPGTPGNACGGFIEQLPNGDLSFSVTYPRPQAYVEVFVRQNGTQNVAHNIVQSRVDNPDGTFTYTHIAPANNYESGDSVIGRFYSYEVSSPGVFTPGPIEWVWSSSLIYGQNTCTDDITPKRCNPYITPLPNGNLKFAVTFPAAQTYVEVFINKNGSQIVAQNIKPSQVANGNGTYTYSYTALASQFQLGDGIVTRFYSYINGQSAVFTPGPGEQAWSPGFKYGQGACTEGVLGFDDTQGWTITSGTMSVNDRHVEGTKSIAITGFTSTELRSVLVRRPYIVEPRLSLFIVVPEGATGDEEMEIFLSAPSAGLAETSVGTKLVDSAFEGSFKRVDFELPPAVLTKLQDSYTDLSVRIAFRNAAAALTYLFDGFAFFPSLTLPYAPRLAPPDTVRATLSFETLDGWTITGAGGALQTSPRGGMVLALSGFQQAQLVSPIVTQLGRARGVARFLIKLPSATPQGWASLSITAPSLGITKRTLGRKTLAGVPFGKFQQLMFDLPPDVEGILRSSISDLRFVIDVNSGGNGGVFLFDALDVAIDASVNFERCVSGCTKQVDACPNSESIRNCLQGCSYLSLIGGCDAEWLAWSSCMSEAPDIQCDTDGDVNFGCTEYEHSMEACLGTGPR